MPDQSVQESIDEAIIIAHWELKRRRPIASTSADAAAINSIAHALKVCQQLRAMELAD